MAFGRRAAMSGLCLLGCAAANDMGTGPDSCNVSAGSGGALELVQMSNCTVYIGVYNRAERPNVLHQFEKWDPIDNGWSLNSAGVRYTTMSGTCLYASPGASAQETIKIDTNEPWESDGGPILWTHLVNMCSFKTVMGGCFPDECNSDTSPKPGSLKFYQINKCHKMHWNAGTPVNKITDPDGNEYIMHACSDENAAKTGVPFKNPKLPDGWVAKTEVLTADFTLTPNNPYSMSKPTPTPVFGARKDFNDLPCGYTLIQDSEGNGYHRIKVTTGDKVVEGKLKLLFGGMTPAELMNRIRNMIIGGVVIGVLLISACVYCFFKNRAASEESVEMTA